MEKMEELFILMSSTEKKRFVIENATQAIKVIKKNMNQLEWAVVLPP